MRIPFKVKGGLALVTLAFLATSCNSSNSEASLPELIDRVCTVMKPIGYDFTDETIQALDASVQEQLLADIAEIEKLSPGTLDVSLATLCR